MSIRGRGIRKAFGAPPQEVLKGIGLQVNEGEFVAITGRSGSGKSTLLYTMSSLDPATAGELDLDRKDINAMDAQELHRFRNKRTGLCSSFITCSRNSPPSKTS